MGKFSNSRIRSKRLDSVPANPQVSAVSCNTNHPILQLQRIIGNQSLAAWMNSGSSGAVIQRHPGDGKGKEKAEENEDEDVMALEDKDLQKADLDSEDENYEMAPAEIPSSLDAKAKLRIMYRFERRRGLEKNRKMRVDMGKKAIRKMHDPAERSAYSARRAKKNKPKDKTFKVGAQNLRITNGNGHFIVAGGNKEDRPSGVTEPKADYNELFTDLLNQKPDTTSRSLFTHASGGKSHEGEHFTDSDISKMAFTYMQSDADKLHEELPLGRTQLTENLSKLTGITDIAEGSRSRQAVKPNGTSIPYDASLLSRQGLMDIAESKSGHTLVDMFYKGTGGQHSIFMGAPSKEHAPDEIGGAEVLKNPLNPDFQPRLERQMSIFPDEPQSFMKAFNRLLPQTPMHFEEPTKEEIERHIADKLLRLQSDIETVPVPSKDGIFKDEYVLNIRRLNQLHEQVKRCNPESEAGKQNKKAALDQWKNRNKAYMDLMNSTSRPRRATRAASRGSSSK